MEIEMKNFHTEISNAAASAAMNFNLSSGKSNDSKIKYGLNSRGDKSKISSNVFGGSDSDDEGSNDDAGGLFQTNRQIAAEQAALRKRAVAAAAAVQDSSIYDYDGAYESFKSKQDDDNKKGSEERSSRYVKDLLKAAKNRERERDTVYERKMAREQAKEEEELGLEEKEKFVTKAYKRKLEERKRWEADEDKRRKEEEANDVTKKSAGDAFTSFYGNLSKNVSLGGSQTTKESIEGGSGENESADAPKSAFLDGFERTDAIGDNEQPQSKGQQKEDAFGDHQNFQRDTLTGEKIESGLSTREVREKKVVEARIRYLQRKAAQSSSRE